MLKEYLGRRGRWAGPATVHNLPGVYLLLVLDKRPHNGGKSGSVEADQKHFVREEKREGQIDDLLHEIRLAGGLPEFEESVRSARRILVRSHGE